MMRPAPAHWTDLLSGKPWTIVQGGVVRGDATRKQLAMIFTGGEFGEGAGHILDVLARQNLRASFFVTGEFLRRNEHQHALQRMIADGHYLGPHSDSHPLYCSWEDRSTTLVTEAFFKCDLQKNIDELRELGALSDTRRVVYFIPPFEWYNADQSRWAAEMNVLLFNFTPGTGSNRDWAPEGHRSFVPSQRIIEDILAYERDRTKDPHGLNGFLLLLHIGSQRQDKTWKLLEPLIQELKRRGYCFARVDELLAL